MCGRYTLRSNQHQLQDAFPLFEIPELPARFNIAPSQNVAAIRVEAGESKPSFASLRWGLLPYWAKTPKDKPQPINARSEGVATNRMFSKALQTRRCLVLADGYYEWVQAGEKKQPYYIRLANEKPFAFAGLWNRWESKTEGEVVESCTIMTTEANEMMQKIHHRMPVILPASAYEQWLDPKMQDAGAATQYLLPYNSKEMAAYPVSTRVNNPRNDKPECIEPAV